MSEIGPGQIVWAIITLLASLASIAAVIIAGAGLRKRTPPVPEEMAKDYVRKPELKDAESRVNDRITREIAAIQFRASTTEQKLDTLITTTNNVRSETSETLGRIEGKLDLHLENDHP